VPLPGSGKASHTDLWCLARADGELVSVAVEGKVDEPFGPTLEEWLVDASEGKLARLAFLRDQLRLPEDALHPWLRYQLLHRTAAALFLAERFRARHAVMLVHSFHAGDAGVDDYARFLELFGAKAEVGAVVPVGERGGVQLHFGWVRGGESWRER